MSFDASELQAELLDAGQAIGLIDGSGNLVVDWFESPVTHLEGILSEADQRAALLRALEGLLPSDPNAPVVNGERWHPLLGADRDANVYLVVSDDGTGTVRLGAAVAAAGPAANVSDPSKPSARLAVRVPLLVAGPSGLSVVAATAADPITVELRVVVGLVRGSGGSPIGLHAMRAAIALDIASPPTVRVVLEGLDLGDSAVQDEVVLDPQNLAGEAAHVVVGLLRAALSDTAGMDAASSALAGALPGVLGLVDGIPALPVVELLHDPSAFRGWLTQLVTPPGGGGAPPVLAWLGQLASLLGVGTPATGGTGTATDPWYAVIADIGTGRLQVQLGVDSDPKTGVRRVLPGLAVVLKPSAAGSSAELQASATLAAIPLSGTAASVAVPAAHLLAVSPSGGGSLVSTSTVTIGSARGGLTWDALSGSVAPLLEFEGVSFGPLTDQTVDLSNATSIENAAATAVRAAIHDVLGTTGPGAALCALIGLDAPAGATGWPASQLADLPGLAAHPLAEIASVHRRILAGAAPNDWGAMLGQVAALVGLTGAPQGSGGPDDPWRVTVASEGSLSVDLVAWNDPDGTTDRLRIGLRAGVATGPLTAAWQCSLAGFDLPATGAGAAKFLGSQRLGVSLSPVPVLPAAGGVTIGADAFKAAIDWHAGSPVQGTAELTGVTVSGDGLDIAVGTMSFPAAPGTAANPLAGLGVGASAVEGLARILALRAAATWGGPAVSGLATLLGLGAGLPGLPDAWPRIGDPATPGALFEHPLAALQKWWAEVLTAQTADGAALGAVWAGWAGQLLQGALAPAAPSPALQGIAGRGTHDDPWVVPFESTAGAGIDGLLWLEPGPPAAWLSAAVTALGSAASFDELLAAVADLSPFAPGLGDVVRARDLGQGAAGLAALAAWLGSSDGVVPVTSQQPTATGWSSGGAALDQAPQALPGDTAAIAQIQMALGALPTSTPVLCISAAFGSAGDWQPLIGSPPGPASAFDFRQAGVPPAGVDLTGVTSTGRFYTCDLADDGSGDTASLALQVTRALGQVAALHGGAPIAVVAHSTSALAALTAIQAAPAGTANALIALGAPLAGSPLTALTDPAVSDAVRLVAGLAPSGVPDAPLAGAIAHLLTALDGYEPPASAGGTPVPAPYPLASFAAPQSLDLPAGVTGTAIAARLGGDLLASLWTALQAAAAALTPPTAEPTHAGVGARIRLASGGAPAGTVVDASVRLDVGHVALGSSAPSTPPVPTLRLLTTLTGDGGWLVGGPAAGAVSGSGGRVRWAEFGIDVTPPPTTGAAPGAVPRLLLHDAALRAPARATVALADADAGGLLGEVLRAASTPAPPLGGPVASVLAALGALGIAVPDGHGGIGVAADALAALQADAVAFAEPRLAAALDTGIFGLSGPAGGPWATTPGAFPLDLEISAGPWTIRLATPTAGLDLGGVILTADVSTPVPALTPAISASLQAGRLRASITRPAGGTPTVTLNAPPWVSDVALVPAASDLGSTALELIPRLALSSAASAVLDALVGPTINVGPIDGLLAGFGQWVNQPGALGAGGGGFDATRIAGLLSAVGTAAGLTPGPGGSGITLPGGLVLTATGGDPLVVSLQATGIGGVLDIAAGLSIDRLGHVTPDGTATIHVTLPGATWASATIVAGAGAAGLSLAVTPGSGTPITLLPTVSGVESILSGLGGALLPALLDAALPELQGSPLATPVLALTSSLGLSDPTGNFAGHAATWAQVGQPGWFAGLRSSLPGAALDAVADLVNGPFATAGLSAAHPSGAAAVTISLNLPGAGGAFTFAAGWDTAGPLIALGMTDFAPAGSPIVASSSLGFAGGQLACSLTAGVAPLADLPIDFQPAVAIAFDTSHGLSASILPFGVPGAADLAIVLAPTPGLQPTVPNLTRLVTQWLLPAVTDAALSAFDAELSAPLWNGGSSAEQLLKTAGILQDRSGARAGQPALELIPDLDLSTLPLRALQAASGLEVPAGPDLTVSLVTDPAPPTDRLGLRLKGYIDIPTGSLDVRALFGGPNGQPGADSGITLHLVDVTNPSAPKLLPSLHVVGLGVGLLGPDGGPLVDTSAFTLGGVEGYLFFDVDFVPGLSVSNPGAGVELSNLGIPLAVAGQSSGSSNPVAQSIVGGGSGGDGQTPPGDSRPVNPGISVSAYDRDGTLSVLISGATSIAIPVHESFGPLHLEQIEVGVSGTDVSLGLDGGLTLAGLTVDVIDLGVDIPLKTLLHPDTWTMDLRGLAASLDEPGISIAGGLMKSATTPVEYDGMLAASIVDLGGITVVGSYARPSDAQGGYTSLFIFVALDIPLGGPPFLFVLGLGGGVGINRELIVPDITGVETFLLVTAIDDNSLANDPLTALMQMGQLMPPRRGAYWIAAGLRFSTFALVTTTAVVYVSLDRGVEVGVLGISRMALPEPDVALISVELALKARYSSSESLLSVQAQLTDNSWLFYQDCQLTGGFAFFMWFADAQFVLTLGGYHPAFQAPDGFPTVPRLGFHWQVSSLIVIKGEAYFALTTSCVMAGGLLEAVFDAGFVRAWFNAHADLLISWDPFLYDVDIGISVGVSLTVTICFIGCATIHATVSIGADLKLAGPPLHGSVEVDYWVVSVTIPFGADPTSPPFLSWSEFSGKYLTSGDPAGTACDAAPATGLLPVDPPGAAPAPGDADHPWRMMPEWSFQATSRVAAASVTDVETGNPIVSSDVGELDLAPMGGDYTSVTSVLALTLDAQGSGGSWAPATLTPGSVVTTATESQMPEGTWHYTDKDSKTAAARTLTAVTGATITGHAVLPDQGSDIHIATLVDDLIAYSKPLPLNPGATAITSLKGFGVSAAQLAGLSAASTSPVLLGAATDLLSGALAAQARVAVGAAAAGMGTAAVRALQTGRSSPPVITPLATGLDMLPVSVAAAPPDGADAAGGGGPARGPARPSRARSAAAPGRGRARADQDDRGGRGGGRERGTHDAAQSGDPGRRAPAARGTLRRAQAHQPRGRRALAPLRRARHRRVQRDGDGDRRGRGRARGPRALGRCGNELHRRPAGAGNAAGDGGRRPDHLPRSRRQGADRRRGERVVAARGAGRRERRRAHGPRHRGRARQGRRGVAAASAALRQRRPDGARRPGRDSAGHGVGGREPAGVRLGSHAALPRRLAHPRPPAQRPPRARHHPPRDRPRGDRRGRCERAADLAPGAHHDGRHPARPDRSDGSVQRRPGHRRNRRDARRAAPARRWRPPAGLAVRRHRRPLRGHQYQRRECDRLAPCRRRGAHRLGRRVGCALERQRPRGSRPRRRAQPRRSHHRELPRRLTGADTATRGSCMSPPLPVPDQPLSGYMRLFDAAVPPLRDGSYRLTVSANVAQQSTPAHHDNLLDETLDRQRYFTVEGPRFTMDPGLVAGVFPPQGAHGPFADSLPQIVLNRRTLPWERVDPEHRIGSGRSCRACRGWRCCCSRRRGEHPAAAPAGGGARRRARSRALAAGVSCDALQVQPRPARRGHAVRRGARAAVPTCAGQHRRPRAERGRRRRLLLGRGRQPAAVAGSTAPGDPRLARGPCRPRAGQPPPVVDSCIDHASGVRGGRPTSGGSPRRLRRDPASAVYGLPRVGAYRSPISRSRSRSSRPDRCGCSPDSWQFTCEGDGTFQQLMQGLDVGMFGTVDGGQPAVSDTGHLATELQDRAGETETVWYRGPLVPYPLTRDRQGPYHSADQARRVSPETGTEDISYAPRSRSGGCSPRPTAGSRRR